VRSWQLRGGRGPLGPEGGKARTALQSPTSACARDRKCCARVRCGTGRGCGASPPPQQGRTAAVPRRPGRRPVRSAPDRIGPTLQRMVSLGPSRVDHIPAFRIALGLAIPMLVLLATDRVEWAMYVGFGAFTGIYSKYEPTRLCFRRQSLAGAML